MIERRIRTTPPFFLWTSAADHARIMMAKTMARTPVTRKFGITVIAGKQPLPWHGGPIALIRMPLGAVLPWSVSL
jgi:hypothetical protein